MKDKLLKLKLEAESYDSLKSTKGGRVCCLQPGSGCDCTSDVSRNVARFNVWIDRMTFEQSIVI